MQLSVQKFSSNVIELVLKRSEYDTVERYMKKLCDIEVMKGLIKNTYGFYVMHTLSKELRRHKASVKPVFQAIQETIQYCTDKNLRSKWQHILSSSSLSQTYVASAQYHGGSGYYKNYN